MHSYSTAAELLFVIDRVIQKAQSGQYPSADAEKDLHTTARLLVGQDEDLFRVALGRFRKGLAQSNSSPNDPLPVNRVIDGRFALVQCLASLPGFDKKQIAIVDEMLGYEGELAGRLKKSLAGKPSNSVAALPQNWVASAGLEIALNKVRRDMHNSAKALAKSSGLGEDFSLGICVDIADVALEIYGVNPTLEGFRKSAKHMASMINDLGADEFKAAVMYMRECYGVAPNPFTYEKQDMTGVFPLTGGARDIVLESFEADEPTTTPLRAQFLHELFDHGTPARTLSAKP